MGARHTKKTPDGDGEMHYNTPEGPDGDMHYNTKKTLDGEKCITTHLMGMEKCITTHEENTRWGWRNALQHTRKTSDGDGEMHYNVQ